MQPRTARLIDRAEQAVVIVLYGAMVVRLWPHPISAATWHPLLLLLSEGLVVAFLVIRRPTDRVSDRASEWAVAFAATFMSLLVVVGPAPSRLADVGAVLLAAGLLLQVSAKLSLRRSFGLVAANRGVKSGGVYNFIRHPMYAGYMVTHAGFLVIQPLAWNFAVYGVLWLLLLHRIRAEERILGQDPAYQAFAERVRWRLAPGLI